jgi:hypothetical protein
MADRCWCLRESAALIPRSRAAEDGNDRKHDRYFDQDADDSCERRAGLKAEEADGCGDREFEKITRADQR